MHFVSGLRKALVLTCALGAPFLVPAVAAAHPAGGMGDFSAVYELTCGIPDAEACPPASSARAAGNDSRAQVRSTAPQMSPNMRLLSNTPRPVPFEANSDVNSDLAFWDKYAVAGNYDGFQIFDLSTSPPTTVAKKHCPGSQNDVSVFRNLIITSTDSVRNSSLCENNTSQNGSLPNGWEGLRIFDWSNPANPEWKAAVLTDCGSHTHTTIPDLANNRLLVYVSSYSPSATTPNCLPPHDKISIVEIPLNAPETARVLSEPVLFPNGGQSSTSGCHDITAYPAKGLAAGACMGEGIIMDITNPAAPKVLSTVTDPNFAFWHSATFSNDGRTVVFTDELGGGTAARCTDAYGPNRGADAFYDISKPWAPVFKSYYKIPRYNTTTENCVSHNGSLIPSRKKNLLVQAWYQGGTSVVDFTDPANPKEIGWFDRGPISDTTLVTGGHWSSYFYNGKIYGNEIYRGFDVMKLKDSYITAVNQPYLNVQTQEPLF